MGTIWIQFVRKLHTQSSNSMLLFLGPIRNGISNLTSKWMDAVSSPILELFLLKREPQNVSFDELMGVDDIIKQFRQYICVLQGKSERKSLPQGIFLFGPPRTGKTTLVHAMAHEAKMVAIHRIEDLDVIAGEERNPKSTKALNQLKLLGEDRKFQPTEPEAASLPLVGVGLSTSQPPPYTVEDGIETHNPWKTLLTEMEEGYYRNKGTLVLVIGATNRLWSLDEDTTTKSASKTRSVWGDLQEIGDESTRLAARRGGDHVSMDDVRQAIERVNVILRIEDR
ncbi:ATPase, AAA-type, core, P-loop containing nucleoside triphosphate hydrolase [Tanacetum coccineum]